MKNEDPSLKGGDCLNQNLEGVSNPLQNTELKDPGLKAGVSPNLINCFLLLLTVFSICLLSGEERIGGTLENVDLMIADLINEDHHNYGDRYFAINHNDYPMRVSIKMTDGFNADDNLIRNTVIVEPHDGADLGLITQKDLLKSADWKYEWQTRAD